MVTESDTLKDWAQFKLWRSPGVAAISNWPPICAMNLNLVRTVRISGFGVSYEQPWFFSSLVWGQIRAVNMNAYTVFRFLYSRVSNFHHTFCDGRVC